MKQTDIKKCAICKEGIMHSGVPIFCTIKVQRHILKLDVCKRQTGLEMMLGNAHLANVMGPNEDISEPVSEESDFWVCEDCAREYLPNALISFDE